MKIIPLVSAAALLLASSPALSAPLVLRAGTDIRLETVSDISSKHAKEGDRVDLRVVQPVTVNGTTVIPAGAPAFGEITRAKGNSHLGKSGKLSMRVDYVDVAGQQVRVRGQESDKGGGGAVGMVGAAIVFLPLGALVKGKEAKITAGTPVDVFVAQDVPVEFGDRPAGIVVPPPGY